MKMANEGDRAADAVKRLTPSTARDLFPGENFRSGALDYSPIVASFGVVCVRADGSGYYQGDSYVLYRDGDRFGVLVFGWGSCSGCDALQACGSVEEVDVLIDSLRDQIKWFPSGAEALTWIKSHDWEGDFVGDKETKQEFVEAAVNYLDKLI